MGFLTSKIRLPGSIRIKFYKWGHTYSGNTHPAGADYTHGAYDFYAYEGGSRTELDNWQWQVRNSGWEEGDVTVEYYHPLGEMPIVMNKLTIGALSCNSGGRYWNSWWGWQRVACGGYGGTYQCQIHVIHTGKEYVESRHAQDITAAINAGQHEWTSVGPASSIPVPNEPPNMISPGIPNNRNYTAAFQPCKYREFAFDDCPMINPGDSAMIHFRITSWNSGSNRINTAIKFDMSASVLNVQVEPAARYYIWQMGEDGKWHPKRPYYVMKNGEWTDCESLAD